MSRASGKSKSLADPNGIRRIIDGKALAPRSIRRKGKKRFLDTCTERQLEKAQVKLENE